MQATQGVPFPEEEADLPMQTTIATRRRKAPLGIVAIFRRKCNEATSDPWPRSTTSARDRDVAHTPVTTERDSCKNFDAIHVILPVLRFT